MQLHKTQKSLLISKSKRYIPSLKVFGLYREKDNEKIRLAKECLPHDFYNDDENQFYYKGKYQIFLEPIYCLCQYFIDIGTCKHHHI